MRETTPSWCFDGNNSSCEYVTRIILVKLTTTYVFHDRVTLFFADNFSTECRITMEFLHNFF